MSELLPCPFCGGPATMECDETAGYARFSAGCSADEPECMGYQSLTTFNRRSEAVKAWNKRTPLSPSPVGEIYPIYSMKRP